MGMQIRLAAAGLIAATLMGGVARADRIYLRDGDSIEGWIVEEKPDRIVVKVIQGGTVGRMTIDPGNVLRIDRTRTESLDDALARAQKERAAEPPPPPPPSERPATTPTDRAKPATGGAGAGTGGSPKGIDPSNPKTRQGSGKTAADLIPKATPEQEIDIQAKIDRLGDVRKAGGAPGRREAAVSDLTAMGAVVIPYVTQALADGEGWRRANAARVLKNVALTVTDIAAYQDALPTLVMLLQDKTELIGQYVRADAAGALREITNEKIDWPEPSEAENAAAMMSPAEVAALEKWTSWWSSYQQSAKTPK